MPIDSPLFWSLAIVGVIFTGISKSGFAGGAGVVAVPLLAFVISVPQAAALMLPLLLVMDVRTIQYYRDHIHWDSLKQLLPAAVVGIAAGGMLLGILPDHWLELMLGLLSVLFASWARLTPILGKLKNAGVLWGGLSGITSTVIHSGGPPMNIYLISRQLPKLEWIATAGMMFGLMNLIKIIPYVWVGEWTVEMLLVALALVPAALLGIKLGYWLQSFFNQQRFEQWCRGFLFVSGVLLLAKSFAGL
ncbi:MAG: sulfite exporter TauE/SafE family protein [Pseudomonadales bacterium]|nr:sulfite exporter TauE/SafE family protein [Pseudomonadales bacterium]